MSKLLRSELKGIVKECLLEILSEGIGSNNQDVVTENQYHNKPRLKSRTKSEDREGSVYRQKKDNFKSKKLKNTNLTTDPILNELLADTAQTTLQEQVAADSKRGIATMSAQQGDAAARAASNSNPTELFGEQAASKWSKLAFFDQ